VSRAMVSTVDTPGILDWRSLYGVCVCRKGRLPLVLNFFLFLSLSSSITTFMFVILSYHGLFDERKRHVYIYDAHDSSIPHDP
jgi:hypothetical protein